MPSAAVADVVTIVVVDAVVIYSEWLRIIVVVAGTATASVADGIVVGVVVLFVAVAAAAAVVNIVDAVVIYSEWLRTVVVVVVVGTATAAVDCRQSERQCYIHHLGKGSSPSGYTGIPPPRIVCRSGSSCFFQCGSGFSWFFNADPDPVKKRLKNTVPVPHEEFSVVGKTQKDGSKVNKTLSWSKFT